MQVTVYPRGMGRTIVSGPLGIPWGVLPAETPVPKHMSDVGELTAVSYSTRYEDGFGGHDLAEWTIKDWGGYVGGMFRPGDHVRIALGGAVGWEGEYSEATPNDDGTVTMRARGYGYNLLDYDSIFWNEVVALPDIYYPTTKLGSAIDNIEPLFGWGYAVYQLGMPISQVVPANGIPDGPLGGREMADTPVKIGPILTALLQELDPPQRWAVWGRTLVMDTDDLTPVWRYDAPDTLIAVADTDYATHVGVWYCIEGPDPWDDTPNYSIGDVVSYDQSWWKAIIANQNVTPVAGATWEELPVVHVPNDFGMVWAIDNVGLRRFDVRTEVVDYRGLGKLASKPWQGIADNLLSQVKGRFILTGNFTVGPKSGFSSFSGGDAGNQLGFVRAGQAIELAGLRTSQGNLTIDGDTFLISQTQYQWAATGEESLTVTPLGAVPRNLGEILRGVPLDAGSVAAGGRVRPA